MVVASIVSRFSSKRVILASQSPRRKELLGKLGIQFETIPSEFEENLDKSKFPTPDLYVVENAKQKALDVMNRLKSNGSTPDLVIGTDTVVVHNGMILEKPKNKDDAVNMLTNLSNESHHVYSGVALITPSSTKDTSDLNTHLFFEETEVRFGPLTSEDIQAYIETGEPMDKAGSYGIQGIGGAFVREINGCYHNVVGFPLNRFCMEVQKLL